MTTIETILKTNVSLLYKLYNIIMIKDFMHFWDMRVCANSKNLAR